MTGCFEPIKSSKYEVNSIDLLRDLLKTCIKVSPIEIQQVSPAGIWLFACGSEYFLPYDEYPWFKNAKISEIYNIELLHGDHIYWPDLDVDLELESLEEPHKFPLVYKSGTKP